MNIYRAYMVGPDGRHFRVEVLDAATDAAAIETAKRFTVENDVEVWQGERRITLLKRDTQRI
jgi:hypothetical protein